MGDYKEYQVTEYDIRQSIRVIGLKVFEIGDMLENRGGERSFPETEFPAIEVFRRPEDEFKKSISKEFLDAIALHLAANVASTSLVHSEEYERTDNEPIYQIWTPEYLKKNSELAFYGLGGNETALVKRYLIDLDALKWLSRIIADIENDVGVLPVDQVNEKINAHEDDEEDRLVREYRKKGSFLFIEKYGEKKAEIIERYMAYHWITGEYMRWSYASDEERRSLTAEEVLVVAPTIAKALEYEYQHPGEEPPVRHSTGMVVSRRSELVRAYGHRPDLLNPANDFRTIIKDSALEIPIKSALMGWKEASLSQLHSSPLRVADETSKRSGKESGAWIPSEKELVGILCRIRETDWMQADYRANHALAELTDGTVKYKTGAPFGEYGEYLWKRKNYHEIPPEYMLSPKAWRMMALSAILNDLFSHKGPKADGYRLSLSKSIDDYRFAAKCKLIDVLQWQRDQDQPDSPEYEALECRIRSVRDAEEFGAVHLSDSPIRGWLIEFLGDGERSEYDVTNDEHLVKRVIIAQKLKDLLSSRTVRSDNGLVGTDAGLCVEVPKQIRWRGEKKLLIRLAECLHDDGFVVNPESFIIQFNMDKPEVENPCVWIKSNALLVYLFDFLRGDEMKMIYKNDATDKIIEKHFCKSNYSVISNFKQTRNGYQNTKEGKPKGAEKIDRIVGIVISCE